MTEAEQILSECPDAVTVAFNGATTPGLWLTRVKDLDGEGRLLTQARAEHLVISTGSLPGLSKKSIVTLVEGADAGGAEHQRRVTELRPKDDDRALTRVMVEEL